MSSGGLLFTAQILLEAVTLPASIRAELLTKFNIKMQDFERVLN